MQDELSWAAVRRLVYDRASGCCEYCQTCEANTGQAMHVEHIDPVGGDIPENLCLSCPSCNLSKAKTTIGHDPETGDQVALFNPRTQSWVEHFAWSEDGIRLRGLSVTGRGTIHRLRMNQQRVLVARQRWVEAGYHPPHSLG